MIFPGYLVIVFWNGLNGCVNNISINKNVKESHKESSENISNEDSVENISANYLIETTDVSIAAEVTNNIQDSSQWVDFAVADSNSINITKTNFDSTEKLKL